MIEARLKYIVKSQKGKVPKTFSDNNSFFPYLSMEYLREKNEEISYVVDDGKCLLVDENDVLVLWDGANAGEIILSKRGFLSSTMAVLTPDERYFQKRFLFYFLKSKESEFKKAANGTTIPHLDQEIVFETRYFIPDISEQESITNYLDTQSEKINNFIRKKQRFIELLKEQRQSIINQAVTKGIDRTVKMKASSVEWLSDVPEHWVEKRLKNLAIFKSGENIASELIEESGQFPVYGGNGLRGYTTNFTHEGDYVLIGRQGALCGNVNYAIGKFWATEHAVVVSPNEVFNLFWFGELLRVMNLNQYSIAAAQPGLAIENIRILKIFVPPFEEQIAIANHVKTEAQSIDIAITKAEREIELIKEYKEAMIAEAVLGKMKN